MKVVEINSYSHGSTGNIAKQIAMVARDKEHTAYVAFPAGRDNLKHIADNSIVIGNRISRNLHLKLAQFTGLNGCFSYFSTKNFIRKLKKIKPDIIHLHNLHNCYINLPLLFKYIKKSGIKTVWTLHDCWSFTGQCPHFIMAQCDRWKTGCHHCSQYRSYPATYVDRTKKMWRLKKKWFTGVENMTLVTPSYWLGDLVKESYLGCYPVKVIHNGINLSVFKPTESNFREKYNCQDKIIILGVSFSWGIKKGLDVFVELSKRLDDKYQIVLVGTNDEVDKNLPDNIISIHHTSNQTELAEIYTAADVFFNPTREEVLGLVNIEALACGTPVITFNAGGSPECVDETCGIVVASGDVDASESAIRKIAEEKPFSKESCIERAYKFEQSDKFNMYVELY